MNLLQILASILTILLFIFLVMGLNAPFEPLHWIVSQSSKTRSRRSKKQNKYLPNNITKVVIYLSGVGAIGGDVLLPDESEFLRIIKKDKNIIVIDDIFPYSMNNNGLNGQRLLAPFWSWIATWHFKNRPFAEAVITSCVNMRNLFQVFISADLRYAPLYDAGTANIICESLQKHGYRFGSGIPIIFIGYSGGAQISISAATYLKEITGAPIAHIGLGGFVLADSGLLQTSEYVGLNGTKDIFQPLQRWIGPMHWQIINSNWNFFKRFGKLKEIEIGPMAHNGPKGYFGFDKMPNSSRRHVDITADQVRKLIRSDIKFFGIN